MKIGIEINLKVRTAQRKRAAAPKQATNDEGTARDLQMRQKVYG
jgi:hypothetical protein